MTAVALLPVGAGHDIRALDATAADWRVAFRTDPCLPLKTSFIAIDDHMAGAG